MNSINPNALQPYLKRMGRAFVIDMIETYLANSPALVDTLCANFHKQNLEEFTRAAHMLKSNSATMGAEKLAALCEQLEQAGQSGRIDHLRPEIESMPQQHREACHELSQLLSKIPRD